MRPDGLGQRYFDASKTLCSSAPELFRERLHEVVLVNAAIGASIDHTEIGPEDPAMAMTMKAKLGERGRRLNGHVCVIPSAVVAQAVASAGADYVIIDQEHSPMGFETLHAMIAATAGTGCAPLVRIPEVAEAAVKRALDAGAEGICFPLVRTVEDAKRCVAAMRYPPTGRRGWGPFVAHSRWGVSLTEYAANTATNTVCMLLVETAEAVDNIEEICRVEGIDCMIVASFDLSTELGVSGQFDHPKFKAAVAKIEAAAFATGIPLGAAGFTEDQTRSAMERGYRLIGAFDILWLKSAIQQSIQWMKHVP
jgi:4-hydroxy-2-oxoheptanedioate aldolase